MYDGRGTSQLTSIPHRQDLFQCSALHRGVPERPAKCRQEIDEDGERWHVAIGAKLDDALLSRQRSFPLSGLPSPVLLRLHPLLVLRYRAENSLQILAFLYLRVRNRSLSVGDFFAPTSACAVNTGDLCRDAQAPLGTARSENSATGAGGHASAETMCLSPTAIVGLKGPLHVYLLKFFCEEGISTEAQARAPMQEVNGTEGWGVWSNQSGVEVKSSGPISPRG